MPVRRRGSGAPGGSGGTIKQRVPPDIFVGANRLAAETARDNGLDADALAEFQADPNLLIILRVGNVDTFQAWRTGAWRDVQNIAEGQRGPGPTPEQLASAVQAGVKAYARLTGGLVPEAEISAAIARDAEVQAMIAAAEADDLDESDVAALIAARLALYRLNPTVVPIAANYIVEATDRGKTILLTGNRSARASLPNASGAGEVPNGWEVVLATDAADLDVGPNGADTINGNAGMQLTGGESIRLQKVATGQWRIIADTRQGAGGDSSEEDAFVPSKSNLYDAVKAIFGHNPSVTPDDENDELDFSPGAAGAIADNSLLPIKARASTAAFMKEWRDRFGAAHIGLRSNTLPPVAEYSVGRDVFIMGRDGNNTVVPFREVSDPSTEITECSSGDVIMLLAAGWTRVGNIVLGSTVVRLLIETAQEAADAAQLATDTIIQIGPKFIVGERTQRNLYVSIQHPLNAYSDANIISVSVQGQTPILQEYFPGDVQRDYTVGITTGQMDNIATQGHFVEGNYVLVEVRLRDGRNGPTHFFRNVFVEVVTGPELRRAFSQNATPASGDRFFFTDENQPGDPVRYAQAVTVAKELVKLARFRTAVGASGSAGNVPAGTEELVGHMNLTSGGVVDVLPIFIPIESLVEGTRDYAVNIRNTSQRVNDGSGSAGLRLTWVSATRTLTYIPTPRSGSAVIGALIARGFTL